MLIAPFCGELRNSKLISSKFSWPLVQRIFFLGPLWWTILKMWLASFVIWTPGTYNFWKAFITIVTGHLPSKKATIQFLKLNCYNMKPVLILFFPKIIIFVSKVLLYLKIPETAFTYIWSAMFIMGGYFTEQLFYDGHPTAEQEFSDNRKMHSVILILNRIMVLRRMILRFRGKLFEIRFHNACRRGLLNKLFPFDTRQKSKHKTEYTIKRTCNASSVWLNL